jgi:hypothetical protein
MGGVGVQYAVFLVGCEVWEDLFALAELVKRYSLPYRLSLPRACSTCRWLGVRKVISELSEEVSFKNVLLSDLSGFEVRCLPC